MIGGGFVGGLVGESDRGTISETYAAGSVTGPVGAVGGLLGYAGNTTVTASYWDTQATGQATSAAGTGVPTNTLKSVILPTGFDPAVWTATPGQYPTLTGVGAPTLPPQSAATLSILAYSSAATITSAELPSDYSVATLNGHLLETGDPSGFGLHAIVFQGPPDTGLVVAFQGSLHFPENLLTSPSEWADLGLTGGPHTTLELFLSVCSKLLKHCRSICAEAGRRTNSFDRPLTRWSDRKNSGKRHRLRHCDLRCPGYEGIHARSRADTDWQQPQHPQLSYG